MKVFAYTVCGIIAVAVAASFFIIGTPGGERLKRFDERRVNELLTIQSEILNFWIKKARLPETLGELESDLGYFIVPTDPQTKSPYEYKILGQYQFELCANFATEGGSTNDYYTSVISNFESKWNHGIGWTCFTRTIDPELYKTNINNSVPFAVPKPLY